MESEPVAPLPTLRRPPASEARRYRQLGYVFAATGAVLFSTKAIFIKLAYAYDVDAETLLAWRMGLSLPVYLIIGLLSIRDHKRRKEAMPPRNLMTRALLVGLLGYWFASYTDFLGLEYISAQFERLILFTYPIFVVLFGAMFFGQRIESRALLGLAVSYAGLALIFGESLTIGGRDVMIGALLVLAAAVAFALYQLLAKDIIAGMGPRLFTCVAMTGAALGAFLQFFVSHPARALLIDPPVLGYAFALAIFATVLPSFFLSAALHRVSAQANGTISTLSPLATIVMAALVLGERMTSLGLVGTVLVLAGVGWFTLSERK